MVRGADGVWTMPAKDGYPVVSEQARRLALEMANLRILEARTSNPALFAEIDLDRAPRRAGDRRAWRCSGAQGERFGTLLVGRTRFGRQGAAGDGAFVRSEGGDQVWLAQGRVTVEREAAKWLARRL